MQRQEENLQRQILQEYVTSSEMLAASPFFRPEEKREIDKAEFSLIYSLPKKGAAIVEVQVALRLPYRSKPLHVPNLRAFLEALRFAEPIFMGGKRFCFSLESFEISQKEIVRMVMDHLQFPENVSSERGLRIGLIQPEFFGLILARTFELAEQEISKSSFALSDGDLPVLPGMYDSGFENPLHFSSMPAQFLFQIEYIPPPVLKFCSIPKL